MLNRRISFWIGIIGTTLAFLASAPSETLAERDALFAKARIQKIKALEVPDFRLKDLNGKWVSIRDFRGKVVLLNLWATWCPYCTKERPGLEAIYQNYKDRGFVVVAVSIDQQGAKIVRPYVEKNKLTFPHLLDSQMKIAVGLFRLRGTPTNYLLDRQGRIIGGAIGYRDWNSPAARKLIESLLAE